MHLTMQELADRLQQCPIEGSFWRHCKGGLYRVTGCAIREDNLDPQVLYRPWGQSEVQFCRPLSEFKERFKPNE